MGRITVVIAALAAMLSVTPAANRYVRQGASGNNLGGDWNNAYTQLSATLVRGDTYYIADGTYPAYTFDDPASGSTLITIKKATEGDHGTQTGWQSTYGDGVAQWGTLSFMGILGDPVPGRQGSHYVLDGVTGSDTTGYGFKLVDKVGASWAGSIGFFYSPVNVTLAHIEIEGYLATDPGSEGDRGINWSQSENGRDILISHCYLHDIANPINMSGTGYVTIEYCYIRNNKSTATAHSAAIVGYYSSHHTAIHHTVLRNIMGTAFITMDGSNWDIHGNVFFNDIATAADWGVGNGIIVTAGASGSDRYAISAAHINVYNNTFANVITGSAGVYGVSVYNYEYVKIFNNLWYNCRSIGLAHNNGISNNNEHDYNTFYSSPYSSPALHEAIKTGDPFTDSQGGDFRLEAATDGGLTLDTIYGKDVYGNTRGADGGWDRGAYEYSTTNIEYRIKNDECRMPRRPCPINDLRIYNVRGERVGIEKINQTGIYLVVDNENIHKAIRIQ